MALQNFPNPSSQSLLKIHKKNLSQSSNPPSNGGPGPLARRPCLQARETARPTGAWSLSLARSSAFFSGLSTHKRTECSPKRVRPASRAHARAAFLLSTREFCLSPIRRSNTNATEPPPQCNHPIVDEHDTCLAHSYSARVFVLELNHCSPTLPRPGSLLFLHSLGLRRGRYT